MCLRLTKHHVKIRLRNLHCTIHNKRFFKQRMLVYIERGEVFPLRPPCINNSPCFEYKRNNFNNKGLNKDFIIYDIYKINLTHIFCSVLKHAIVKLKK